mmetsp:Transcript_16848/g.46264  ORF Transcript_16848/g.46264 Transcript_16848/m.46264 type:complete len:342 (-) Transcript_16848:2755-3780(-)
MKQVFPVSLWETTESDETLFSGFCRTRRTLFGIRRLLFVPADSGRHGVEEVLHVVVVFVVFYFRNGCRIVHPRGFRERKGAIHVNRLIKASIAPQANAKLPGVCCGKEFSRWADGERRRRGVKAHPVDARVCRNVPDPDCAVHRRRVQSPGIGTEPEIADGTRVAGEFVANAESSNNGQGRAVEQDGGKVFQRDRGEVRILDVAKFRCGGRQQAGTLLMGRVRRKVPQNQLGIGSDGDDGPIDAVDGDSGHRITLVRSQSKLGVSCLVSLGDDDAIVFFLFLVGRSVAEFHFLLQCLERPSDIPGHLWASSALLFFVDGIGPARHATLDVVPVNHTALGSH